MRNLLFLILNNALSASPLAIPPPPPSPTVAVNVTPVFVCLLRFVIEFFEFDDGAGGVYCIGTKGHHDGCG